MTFQICNKLIIDNFKNKYVKINFPILPSPRLELGLEIELGELGLEIVVG